MPAPPDRAGTLQPRTAASTVTLAFCRFAPQAADGRTGREPPAPGAVYPRPMRLVPGTAGLLVLALIAGCGSYTKHDFIARADAICASTVRQTRLIPPPSFTRVPAERLHAVAGYVSQVLPLVRAEAAQLRDVRKPTQGAADRATLGSFLAAFGQVLASYQSLATAASAGDAASVARAEASLSASPVAALAARYGLRSCGTPGGTSAS